MGNKLISIALVGLLAGAPSLNSGIITSIDDLLNSVGQVPIVTSAYQSTQDNIVEYEERRFRVTKIIDGDTVVTDYDSDGDGKYEHIRLLGINTRERGQPLYREAKQRLTSLVNGHELRAVRYVGEENYDKYGRELRHIFGETDDYHINLQMVEEGLAKAYPFVHGKIHEEQFEEAQNRAKEARLGIWSDEGKMYSKSKQPKHHYRRRR